MTSELWQRLPTGFLKKSDRGWRALDPGVRRVIVELAEKQGFKCVNCDATEDLVIEHDHDPEHGSGDVLTIYNIRGLACHRCNWHLGLYEKDQRGEGSTNWEHAFCIISDRWYEDYIFHYQCRVHPLLEELEEERMGSSNYWRSRPLLQKFDEWKGEGGRYPWPWGFEEIKLKRHGIRTPLQFFRMFDACLKFVKEQLEKDPSFEVSLEFIKIAVKVNHLIEEAGLVSEPRQRLISGEAVAQT